MDNGSAWEKLKNDNCISYLRKHFPFTSQAVLDKTAITRYPVSYWKVVITIYIVDSNWTLHWGGEGSKSINEVMRRRVTTQVLVTQATLLSNYSFVS